MRGYRTVEAMIRKPVDIPANAEGWDLYTTKPGADAAGFDLSNTLENMLAEGHSKSVVLDTMLEKMREYVDFGALDTEPMNALEDVLRSVYG